MLGYPVTLAKQKAAYTATFRDIPEALTSGRTKAAALEMAADALATAMEFYLEDRRPVPPPSKPRRGEDVVELPASVSIFVAWRRSTMRVTVCGDASSARASCAGVVPIFSISLSSSTLTATLARSSTTSSPRRGFDGGGTGRRSSR